MSDTTYCQKMFALIEGWSASGRSQKVWCAEHGISIHQFQYWKRRHQAEHSTGQASSAPSFVPILLPGTTSQPFAELHYPDGRRLLLHGGIDAHFLKALLA